MANRQQVIDAINHIRDYCPNWRGHLSDQDYQELLGIFNSKYYRTAYVRDELIGALRNQWNHNSPDAMQLFTDDGQFRDPPPNQAPPPPAAHPAPAPPAGAPPAPAPPALGSPAPDDGFAGKAADAAHKVDEALEKNKTALNQADRELVDAVLGAKSGSEEGKAALRGLQQNLIDQITKLGPSLDTPAGQQQLNDYLQGKVQEILGIVNSSGMDAKSKAEVLAALADRYSALHSAPGGQNGQSSQGDPASQAGASPAAAATGPGATATADPPLTDDPLLNGLGPDPLAGLGMLAGPAMGALSGLPGAMGSLPGAMGAPLGALGGLGGDLGSGLGGALRDAAHGNDADKSNTLDDPLESDKRSPSSKNTANEHTDEHGSTSPDGAQPRQNEQGGPIAAAAGQVAAPAAAGPDVSVKLPDGSTVRVDSPQVAQAGRMHLEGASLEDSFRQNNLTLLPPGTPVTEAVPPSRLRFGDYGQYTDHQVMALGDNKVWSGGRVIPLEQLTTGPNFLGWTRAQPTATAATVSAGSN